MCGRYTLGQSKLAIIKAYNVTHMAAEIVPSFNVCPGQDAAAIVGHDERRLGLLRWGLPVSDAVNSPRNDGPELIRPLVE